MSLDHLIRREREREREGHLWDPSDSSRTDRIREDAHSHGRLTPKSTGWPNPPTRFESNNSGIPENLKKPKEVNYLTFAGNSEKIRRKHRTWRHSEGNYVSLSPSVSISLSYTYMILQIYKSLSHNLECIYIERERSHNF